MITTDVSNAQEDMYLVIEGPSHQKTFIPKKEYYNTQSFDYDGSFDANDNVSDQIPIKHESYNEIQFHASNEVDYNSEIDAKMNLLTAVGLSKPQNRTQTGFSSKNLSKISSFLARSKTETTPKVKSPEEEAAEHNLIRKYFDMTCHMCALEDISQEFDYRELKKHMTIRHNMKKTFFCCDIEFVSSRSLLRHCKEHENPITCSKCGETPPSRVLYVKHMSDEHGIIVSLKEKKRNKDTCICNECGKEYKGKEKMKNHLLQVHFNSVVHICEICAIFYKTAISLQEHINREHLGIKPPKAQCTLCGKWVQERCLTAHIKNHTQEPVAGNCPNCGQFFKNKKNLQRHVRERHSEASNRFQCTYCPKAFFHDKKLQEHIATHTGIPLYTCEWCTAVFKSSGNIAAHKRKLHPAEYEQQKMQNKLKREQIYD